MSTILDALKKVERERESPSDRLRHEPEPAPKRARRVSTVTIVVCAMLGFGAGAGIALWRSAAPVADEAPGASGAPAEIAGDAPAAPAAAPPLDVPARPVVAAQSDDREPAEPAPSPAAALAAADDPESALEPSPFEPPPAAVEPPVVTAGSLPLYDEPGIGMPDGVAADPDLLAALPPPTSEADLGGIEDANDPTLDETLSDDLEAEEGVAPAEETVIDTGRSPPGAPRVTLSFLQWSADPARRFAFISVDGGPSQRVREGDSAGAVSVTGITPDGVRLRHADTLFVIRPRH